MEVASVDPEDLDDFLSKVNQVSDLIKDIKSGDDKQAAISGEQRNPAPALPLGHLDGVHVVRTFKPCRRAGMSRGQW
jgi:hypothetical protein